MIAPIHSKPSIDLWTVRFKPDPAARLRLFCCPAAGSGPATFREWPAALPAQVEVCMVQLPGRERRLREAPYRQLSMLVEDLGEALHPYLDLPFAFFGHSLGALISFELARYLTREHALQPVHLFVAGRRAPHLLDPDSPLHQLPDSALVAEVQRRYEGIPEVIRQDDDLMQLFLPILRADFAVIETYAYANEDPLECSITAYGGLQDSRTSLDSLSAWRDQTRGNFTMRLFPGGHFFVNSARSLVLEAFAEELSALAK
ncbi:MAG TPA: alpha/beta fold hydrolase [Anaerolineae bacterium]|nr:alpha/beta fold hydrolase [Anaerolineae bacterium]